MTYLFVDLNMAIKRVNYLEGSVANCRYYCLCYNTLSKYKQQLNNIFTDNGYYTPAYFKAYKKLCNNFKAFMKRHNYFELIKKER